MKKLLFSFAIVIITLIKINSYTQKELLIKYSNVQKNMNQAEQILKGDISLLSARIDIFSISKLNSIDLRILRNYIFAVYGYKFKSLDLHLFFSKYNWYKPLFDDVNNKLTIVDKKNVLSITSFESIDKYNLQKLLKLQFFSIFDLAEDIQKEKNIIGVWQNLHIFAAGWADRFIFFPNNKVIFIYSQMREVPEILSLSGTYQIIGDRINIKINKKVIIEHGNETEYSGAYGYQWTRSNLKSVVLSEEEIFVMPFNGITKSKIPDDINNYVEKEMITIGGNKFYKFYLDPLMGIDPWESFE